MNGLLERIMGAPANSAATPGYGPRSEDHVRQPSHFVSGLKRPRIGTKTIRRIAM